RAILRVEPGPRFRLATATIDWIGAAPDAVAAKAAVSAISLSTGTPGRAADILAAEGRAIAELEKRGYADAEVRPREVVVDHAGATVKPTFRIASGALVRLGSVRSVGKDPTQVAWLGLLA